MYTSLDEAKANLKDKEKVYSVSKPDGTIVFVNAKSGSVAVAAVVKSAGFGVKKAEKAPRKPVPRKTFNEKFNEKLANLTEEEVAQVMAIVGPKIPEKKGRR